MRGILGRLARRLFRSERPEREVPQFVPPGDVYSPIPALDEVRKREGEIFRTPEAIPGVDLNEAGQLALLETFAGTYAEMPFGERPTGKLRYGLKNNWYSYTDGIALYSMIRHAEPKRIIEVGSGHSSAAILDTNDLFFDGRIACTFIEPDPARLEGLLRPADAERVRILPAALQDVDLGVFDALAAGDILLVDSTHVAKVGSDVNRIFFEVLPRLGEGVLVHFHDVFYPFEYPRAWVYEGRAWNEAYLLRAFLQYNRAFEIVFFSSYLWHLHAERFARAMPLCKKNRGGNIWLRKR